MKFRKKPVVIEAWLWDETTAMRELLHSHGMVAARFNGHLDRPNECTQLGIVTLEGTMRVNPGDWIIKGVKGEFYPIKDSIFRETYEPVTDSE